MTDAISKERLAELIEASAGNKNHRSRFWLDVISALRELQQLREQVRVPREPTQKMVQAGYDAMLKAVGHPKHLIGHASEAQIYRAMIAAAQDKSHE